MIGVIMLNTQFPRLKGDIGNPDTFPIQVSYERVGPARVRDVVSSRPLAEEVSQACVDAALRLEATGANVIGTSCGFLATEQRRLQAALSCPVLSSSLLLIPLLRSLYGRAARIGVLSFAAEKLTPRHFNGCFDENTLVQGLPRGGTLYRTILDDGPTLDVARAREEVVAMAYTLQSRTPDLDLLLLECTNLSPFKRDLRQSTRLPVFDLVDALMWIHEAAAVR